MKTTGVVRRIDDLGRIVIPKEIRKTLRIKDGESLEIFLDSDNIILKKYSRLDDINDFYKNYVDSVQSAIGENIMITDNDKFVAIAGDLKKQYLNSSISDYIENIILNRNDIVVRNTESLELSPNSFIDCTYAISPIIVNGDVLGSVILVSSSSRLEDFCEKTVKIAAKFLGKYIE